MEIRQVKSGEEEHVSDLAVKVFKPNMKEQFVRLFSPQNRDHMFVAVDQNKVISAVNYYISDIQSNHGMFKVASIGAVCTDVLYRKQGISTKLLSEAEKIMKKEAIDFCIISGRRGMYKRFGARDVGAISHFLYAPKERNTEFQIDKFQGNIEIIFDIYQKEAIRYMRTIDEFKDLFEGQTYPDSYQTYHTYVIKKSGKEVAYVIVIDHHEKDVLQVKELAGDRKAIVDTCKDMCHMHGKSMIEFMVPYQDSLNLVLESNAERMSQQATIKIISEKLFMDKLNIECERKHVDIRFHWSDPMYQLVSNQKTYEITQDEMHELIFSGVLFDYIDEKTKQELKSFLPLELPWSHNLNYQ